MAVPEPIVEADQEEQTITESASKQLPIGKLFGGVEAAPQADISAFGSVFGIGRQRKYEEKGIWGALSVRQVIVFRKKMRRYPPDTSEKMQEYYDFWYFTKPSKRRDGDNYERHLRAYQRGQKWLTGEHTSGATTMGTGNITDITGKFRAIRS